MNAQNLDLTKEEFCCFTPEVEATLQFSFSMTVDESHAAGVVQVPTAEPATQGGLCAANDCSLFSAGSFKARTRENRLSMDGSFNLSQPKLDQSSQFFDKSRNQGDFDAYFEEDSQNQSHIKIEFSEPQFLKFTHGFGVCDDRDQSEDEVATEPEMEPVQSPV